ncbi:MAG: response regulator transcription factor [Rhodobacteraceae bacterium]|nr:response regulator transcription factor [Paracoccaceae bacterium]MBR9822895.1 response regulator transcription factor [Paracoccaceae bacterium]
MRSILILEDHAETRAALVALVEDCFPGARIAEAGTIHAARTSLRAAPVDLALVDLTLPDGEGYEILRQCARDTPETVCVVTTVMATDAAVVNALAAGASGYLLKTDGTALWKLHLGQIVRGVPVLSPAIARRIMQHFQRTAPAFETDERLTPRETEVLSLIARGMRIPEVARLIGVADSTVATHIKNMYRKLGISNRAEAATHAARLGLL